MELATDIMAIIGWSLIGFLLPSCAYGIRRHYQDNFGDATPYVSMIAFGLIAASFVLG